MFVTSMVLAPPTKDEEEKRACSNVKGYWLPEDKSFGFKGLNVPRSRHASEILKTISRVNGKPKDVHTLWVFGGYNSLQYVLTNPS